MSKTGHLVCSGAQCMCQFGKAPAKLIVLTQTKHYINDSKKSKKLMATHKEIGQPFEPPFFGSCAKVNNGPCAVVVTGWSDYYEKIKIENGGNPLLEGSKATCAVGGKDCISIIYHGQSAEPSEQNKKNTDENVMEQINPLAGGWSDEVDNNPFKGIQITVI